MTGSILHAVVDRGVVWGALMIFQVALTIVAAGVAADRAELAARRRRECERLWAECERLRPLAEVTELQTRVSRALLDVAQEVPGRDARERTENHFAQRRLVPAETDKEATT